MSQMNSLNAADKNLYEKMTVPLGNLVSIAENTQRLRINLRDASDAATPGAYEASKKVVGDLQTQIKADADQGRRRGF